MQILPQALGRAAARLLAGFSVVAPHGEVNAVTGDSLQDRMLFDTSVRLAEAFKLRDRLGPSVFLHALAFQQSDPQGTPHRIGYSQSEAHFLVFLGPGQQTGRVVLRLPHLGDRELTLEAGDGLALPEGSSWVLPQDVASSGRWLHLGYAKGTEALADEPDDRSVGIRLWGYPAGETWRELGLPVRGPNSANTLFVKAFSLAVSVPCELVAGRTDSLNDLRFRIAQGPVGPASRLHETLVVPLDGSAPLFLPCLQDGAATYAAELVLVLDWATAPRIEAVEIPAPVGSIPAETTYLTQLAVTARSVKAGDREDIAIALGDQLLVLHAGSIATGGQVLSAPAAILVPTGSLASYAATSDAELIHVLLERRHTELVQQLPVAPKATVAFCIPLASRDMTANWALATRLFNACLRAIHAQSDPNWIIVAVGNEMPDLTVPVDERFHFISTTIDVTDGSLSGAFADGSNKRQRTEALARELGADYLFFCDWDDIVHPDFVQFIRSTRHPYGYVAGSGYLIDFETQDIAPFPLWDDGGSLDELCTSTLVFNAHAVNPIIGDTEFNYSGHLRHRYLMHAEGRPLMEIPVPSIAYMRFTTLNLSNALFAPTADGSTQFPELRRSIADHSIRGDETICRHFGLDALFAGTGDETGAVTHGPKRLSVLICTHNRPEGLAALLASLVPQIAGHPEREIIVVNDGTHDARYSSVVGQYAAAIRYLPLPGNVGIAQARNRAAELGLGEYLVFTDDDCEVPPSWVDWVDATLRCQPDLDVVAGYTRPLRLETAGFVGRAQAAFDLLPRPYLLSDVELIFVTACLAIRRRTFQRIGGFATGGSFAIAAEDTDLALRLARSGARIRIDEDWHVFHQLATSALSELRRFRRYGYGNRKLAEMPSRPKAYQFLRRLRRRDMPARFVEHFRKNAPEAKRLKAGRWTRLASRIFAALMITAYDYGGASNRPS